MRLLSLMVLVLACPVGHAIDHGPLTNHVLSAVPAQGLVTVDGKVSDWDVSGAIVMTDNVGEPRRLVRVAAMHDDLGLYLLLQFKDRTPMVNHIDPEQGRDRAWCGDCVQLRINTGAHPNQAAIRPLQILHIDAYWFSDGARPTAYVVYGDLSPGGRVERTIDEAEGRGITSGYALDADGSGYTQELRLDWKLLRPSNPVRFPPGSSLHLAIEAMWGDSQFRDHHPATRVTDLLNPQRPERDMIWANPLALGTLEFLAQGGVAPSPTGLRWTELVERHARLSEVALVPAQGEPPTVDRPCLEEASPIEQQLNAWYAAKSAAGNHGDYYDNRDREHSAIERPAFPQLRSWEYAPGQILASLDFGFFSGVRTTVTFGNSSTAGQPERDGCHPRTAMMAPGGLLQLHAQYRSNNLYVYPAHLDYHPGRNGRRFHGDLLPMNQPYCFVSRGSSGSDLPFLRAAIHTSAAFAPEVKRVLVRHGLLMPTLQYLLRSTYRVKTAPADYLSGAAHPAVFDGALLDELGMVEAAHAMTASTIPPLAQVQAVVAEPLRPGVNAPAASKAESLCASPGAVGFVFRRWDRILHLEASATTSLDWQDKPLTYRWVLLQGDPRRVRIEPTADGRQARIAVAWHDRFPVQPGSLIDSNRIDIGLFVNNGASWSAPAFVSVVCPDNERRTYDQHDRLVDIDYAAMDTAIGYETPCIFPAEGVAPYDIRDWPALLRRMIAGEADLFGRLCAASLSDQERAALRAAIVALASESALIAAEQAASGNGQGRHQHWTIARQNGERLSRILLTPATGDSIKNLVEKTLNAWQDDPSWYLDHRPAFAAAIAQVSPEAKALITQRVQKLLELGIYQQDGDTWKLHARQPGDGTEVSRLTSTERAELKRLHLLLQTQVLLPGILQREAQAHYVDTRLQQDLTGWLWCDYTESATVPSSITRR